MKRLEKRMIEKERGIRDVVEGEDEGEGGDKNVSGNRRNERRWTAKRVE